MSRRFPSSATTRPSRGVSPVVAAAVVAFGAPLAPAGDLVPRGPEFALTSDLSYTQKQPWVAMADDGRFVVIYSKGDMFARRFDRDGNPLGPDFKLNPSIAAGEQDEGYVSMDPVTGDFVVTWSDRHGNDGFQMGCAGRFFRADGVPYSPEQILNVHWDQSQFEPHVALCPNGRAIATWSDAGADGSVGVFARLYDRFGTPLSGEVLVNHPQPGTQIDPAVACDRQGNFVIAYVDASGQTGPPREILARLFDSNLQPKGPQFLVNSTSAGMQRDVDVAMDGDGDFVVVWHDESATDGAGFGVFGRLYDKLGAPKGPQFQLSTTGAGNQRDPNVCMDYVGNFVCTWEDDSSGNFDVKIRRFDRNGVPLSGEITANTDLAGDQTYAKSVMNHNGTKLLTIWFDSNSDAEGRLFDLETIRVDPLVLGGATAVAVEMPGMEGKTAMLFAALSASPALKVTGARFLELAPDPLFQLVLAFPGNPVFPGFGLPVTLGPDGTFATAIVLPNDPIVSGLTFHFAGITFLPGTSTVEFVTETATAVAP